MTRSVAVVLLGCTVSLVAGCDGSWTTNSAPGSSVQFIAANSSTVVIDYARGVNTELDIARQVAVEKCALFGGKAAVLESLNTVAGGKERASFLCR